MAYTLGNATVTWTGNTTTTANYSYVLTSTGTGSIIWAPPPGPPPKTRGWNAKQGLRCYNCARFAKEIPTGGNVRLVECARCGKERGFVGKRF